MKIPVATGTRNVILGTDIAGMVAAITESELDAPGEKSLTASLVDRDSATRWARHLAVQ